jgi:protein-S-isoprenylcysteine O-methyltransferase Ste14
MRRTDPTGLRSACAIGPLIGSRIERFNGDWGTSMYVVVIDHLRLLALLVATIRALVIMDGLLFMFLRGTRDIRWNRAMRITFPEPFLLLCVTGYLWFGGSFAAMDAPYAFLLVAGSALSCYGLWLFAWSFVAYRDVGTGHYVDAGHQVVRSGPYAVVRHPMYCAATLIWLGLALAATDWALLTLTFAYVVPTYYFYAKEEEAMLGNALGSAYTNYAAKVPMLFPRPLNVWE